MRGDMAGWGPDSQWTWEPSAAASCCHGADYGCEDASRGGCPRAGSGLLPGHRPLSLLPPVPPLRADQLLPGSQPLGGWPHAQQVLCLTTTSAVVTNIIIMINLAGFLLFDMF